MSEFKLGDIPSQKGRLAVVTGANVGLGYETALALAGLDFEIVLACRNMTKAEKAAQSIKEKYPDAKLMCLEIDLSSQSSVHGFVKQFHVHYKQLDLLINNAGIMMTPYKKTEDGFEQQLAANYLGHFTLTGLMLETLENTKGSRVVMLSSIAHKNGSIHFDDLHFEKKYDPSESYGQSKLACLMFAYELDRRLKVNNYQTKAVAAHPGVTLTNLISHFNPVLKFIARVVSPFLLEQTDKAALPSLRAALDPQVKGGEYFGLSGWREIKGSPVKVDSSPASKNKDDQKRLFKISEELTNTKFFNKELK